MKIRTHIGISVDGYVSTPDGRPTLLPMRDFQSGTSYGHPEFINNCGVPVALGDGVRLVPSGTGQMPLTLQSQRRFPDGSIELVYDVGSRDSV